MSPKTTVPHVGVAVLAAGNSRRMHGVDKLFARIAGAPLLAHCLESFNASSQVGQIVIAASESSIGAIQGLTDEYQIHKVRSIVEGGARRQDSVLNALRELEGCEIVLVHDGARPFVDGDMISRAVETALASGAACAAVPVKDTIKVVGDDMMVVKTPERSSLWAAQTPQAFRYDLLFRAHREVTNDATDDAAMVEALGHPVKLFRGSYENMKVTTPDDIPIAQAVADSRQARRD